MATDGPKWFKSIPENETAVRWIEECLRLVKPLEIVSKAAIREAARCDCFGAKRYLLDRARKRLKRDERILFVPVIGVGLKRCDDSLSIDDGSRRLIMSRRIVRTGGESLACVQKFEELSQEKQLRMLTLQSYIGLISAVMRSDRVKKVEAKMLDKKKEIPWLESLEWLRGMD